MKASERQRERKTPMNAWKTAVDAAVATTPRVRAYEGGWAR